MLVKIQKAYLEEIISIAKDYGKTKIIIYKDIQNAFYGQYVESIALEQYTSENKNTLVEALVSFFSVMSSEAQIIKENGLQSEFVFYTDTGRNNFNRALIPTWKEQRKKSLMDYQKKKPLEATSQSYMHGIFKQLLSILEKVLPHLANTYFYNMHNIDSDYVPYAHRMLSSKSSLHVLVSTDKDYIHTISEHSDTVRYFFLSKYRRLDTKNNGWKSVTRDSSFTDEQRKILFYNYQVFHALAGDGADSMPSLIRNHSFKKWLKVLQSKMSYDSMNEYRQFMIDNLPFNELLEKKVSENWDSSLTNVETYWDIYRLRQLVVDFYFTSIITMPIYLLSPIDVSIRNKLKPLYVFAHNIIERSKLDISETISKKEIFSYDELKHVLKYLSVPESIADVIFSEEAISEVQNKQKYLESLQDAE